MIRTLKLSTIITSAAILAGTAFGQDQQAGTASQPSSTPQPITLQQAEGQEFFRASNIIGKTSQDSQGQKLGTIKDVAFNQQGEIFAFVDIGSGKWAAVPWQVVNPNSAKGKDNVVLNTTQQQLKSAPSVAKDQWGSLNNPAFAQGIYSYYQVQPPASVGGASAPGSSSQGQSQSGSGATEANGQPQQNQPK